LSENCHSDDPEAQAGWLKRKGKASLENVQVDADAIPSLPDDARGQAVHDVSTVRGSHSAASATQYGPTALEDAGLNADAGKSQLLAPPVLPHEQLAGSTSVDFVVTALAEHCRAWVMDGRPGLDIVVTKLAELKDVALNALELEKASPGLTGQSG